MQHYGMEENRALDAQCASERSMPSRLAVSKLKVMSLADKKRCICKYVCIDLANLLRCALTAGISADTLCETEFGNIPLLVVAAQCKSVRCLKALLAKGASCVPVDEDGRMALHHSAYLNDTACMRLLLDAGAQLDAKDSSDASTPLSLAAQEGHVEACSLLLAAGASVDARNEDERTALHTAARFGHVGFISALLDAGAELEARDTLLRTPLGSAARAGKLKALKALLARGADPNAAENLGHTPLVESILAKHTSCVQTLLPVSDLSIISQQGYIAFHVCIGCGNQECFQLLLPLTSDVDVRTVPGVDSDGEPVRSFNWTPLQLACSLGQHNMVKALLRRGASRTSRNSVLRTPLHEACSAGHLSCVVQLLGKPGEYQLTPDEVNATSETGHTPLHSAAENGHTQCCGALLAAGARLDATTPAGHTALMTAQFFHPENAELHELLSGRGLATAPGTVCDNCGAPEAETRLRACSGCLVSRFCSAACSSAAWPAHKDECRRLQAERNEATALKAVS